MTVLVVVRTGSAAILAADSKVTTQGPVGRNPDGSVQFAPQTYEHAVKVATDASSTAIAAFAGNGNIGDQPAVDFFSRLGTQLNVPRIDQDKIIQGLADRMAVARTSFWKATHLPLDQMPATTAIVIGPPTDAPAPRAWRVHLHGEGADTQEILSTPRVWIEGSADMALTLLYGIADGRVRALQRELGIEDAAYNGALERSAVESVVHRINFWTMPVQDAMDFAHFLASVQIEMDRFLPGVGGSGGPIDIMTLEMAPTPTVRFFPGKPLHHPGAP